MPEKPASMSPSEPPRPGPGRASEGDAQVGERYGPLAVERHVKDDGRALLLYTDVGEETT